MISPISGIFVSSSSVALIKLSNVSNFAANTLAVFAPTWGIPNPKINLSKELFLLVSIASTKLVTDLSPNPSYLTKSFSYCFNE